MLIINVDFPAGLTIEETIGEALDFSENNHYMVRCNLNDIDMVIVSGLFPSRSQAIEYYARNYRADKAKTTPAEL